MKLNKEQIERILLGAVRVEEENGLVRPYRFTEEQQEHYRNVREDFYLKTYTSAGMKLEFETDSRTLFLHVITGEPISRSYFSFDVFVNGKMIGNLDNFSNRKLPEPYTVAVLPTGEYSKEFSLGEGMKKVTVYLPWSVSTSFKEISLDDGAVIVPVKYEKTILAIGDSITQGYDAKRPSNRYMSRLAAKIGAEEINKGIGGERFSPEFAMIKEDLAPDWIIVAYGTNDWCVYDRETFTNNCVGFYNNLSKNYPNSKIFAVTPIWRKGYEIDSPFGPFDDVAKIIEETVAPLDNVTLIRGFDFVPKDESYYADYSLHPNDAGFEYHADNLYKAIKDLL